MPPRLGQCGLSRKMFQVDWSLFKTSVTIHSKAPGTLDGRAFGEEASDEHLSAVILQDFCPASKKTQAPDEVMQVATQPVLSTPGTALPIAFPIEVSADDGARVSHASSLRDRSLGRYLSTTWGCVRFLVHRASA